MKIIELIASTGKTKILVGESFGNISKYVPENTIVITDKNVYQHYGNYFKKYSLIIIEPGEQSKDYSTIENICKELIKYNADRDSFLMGVGGGVVTDITGFVASIYKRGLKFGFVTTTLLGQIDASIGGKNGINFDGLKNILGTINQPEFILSDLSTLETLPKRELANGMAELIKTSLIADKKLFDSLERNYNRIFDLEKDNLEDIIFTTAKIKIGIVQKDEKESGLRRILNFGHSIGHAIESVTKLSHGESISIGMVKALQLSVDRCGLNKSVLTRVRNLLINSKLPIETDCNSKLLFDVLVKDKKMYGNKIKFILLEDIGKPIIHDIEINEIKEYL